FGMGFYSSQHRCRAACINNIRLQTILPNGIQYISPDTHTSIFGRNINFTVCLKLILQKCLTVSVSDDDLLLFTFYLFCKFQDGRHANTSTYEKRPPAFCSLDRESISQRTDNRNSVPLFHFRKLFRTG